MSRIDNAFTRSTGSADSKAEVNTAQFAPLKASLSETANGWRLSLNPIRTVDALEALRRLSPSHAAETLLFDVTQTNLLERGRPLTLLGACGRLEIEPIASYGEDAVVVNDAGLAWLLAEMQTTQLCMVRVDGPIEPGDAKAILAAMRAGLDPCDVEFRTVASVVVKGDRDLEMNVREKAHAAALVAENFRQYLAALLDRPATGVSTPFTWQIEHLLDAGHGVLVRPIETEIFSGSVDVGVCSTADEQSAGPAAMSIVYDIPSDTWHDES